MNKIEYKSTADGTALDENKTVADIELKDDSDLYIFYDGVKPIIKEQVHDVKYESLTKYSFIDDKTKVKYNLNFI